MKPQFNSAEEALAVLPSLLRVPVEVSQVVENHVDDEGEEYTLSYPAVRVLGTADSFTFYEEGDCPLDLLQMTLQDQGPGVVTALLGCVTKPQATGSKVDWLSLEEPEILDRVRVLIDAAWAVALDIHDNRDAPLRPAVTIRPRDLSMTGPLMAAP